MSGCTRVFYRRSADNGVNEILAEKDKVPEWKIEQYHVYADKRSRFVRTTTDPDHAPDAARTTRRHGKGVAAPAEART